MTDIILRLEAILRTEIFHDTIQDYAVFVVTFFGLLVLFSVLKRFAVHHLGRIAAKTSIDFDDFMVDLISNVAS